MKVGQVEIGEYMSMYYRKCRLVEYKGKGDKCKLCICTQDARFKDCCYKNNSTFCIECSPRRRSDKKSAYLKPLADIKRRDRSNSYD